ncbi:unnamed protein product [Symbiodinium natans]|uniref:Uncharacterized protein n=1 Tax=Symbiodinium natans TaxID=878477 RepID=A0A812TKI4_9DINO|nr:unnamed protein product [Symbiodinium natans]
MHIDNQLHHAVHASVIPRSFACLKRAPRNMNNLHHCHLQQFLVLGLLGLLSPPKPPFRPANEHVALTLARQEDLWEDGGLEQQLPSCKDLCGRPPFASLESVSFSCLCKSQGSVTRATAPALRSEPSSPTMTPSNDSKGEETLRCGPPPPELLLQLPDAGVGLSWLSHAFHSFGPVRGSFRGKAPAQSGPLSCLCRLRPFTPQSSLRLGYCAPFN